jgi:hypothetical protein
MGFQPGSVRVDCSSCGYHLGALVVADDRITNVDKRAQPSPPRLARHDSGTWGSNRKCGATDRVREESLRYLIAAVAQAGLTHMPFRAPSR